MAQAAPCMPYPDPPPLPAVPTQFRVALTLCVLANLVPIWLFAWMPLGDFAGHVQMLDVMMRHSDPATLYHLVFALPRHLDTGLLPLGLAWLLPVGDGLLAGRLLLSLYVIALPLAFLHFVRWMRRDPWLSLWAIPLTWNALAGVGMLDDLLALPLLFWALAEARAYAEHGGLRGLRVAALLVALFLTQPFALGLALVGVAAVVIWHRQDTWGLTKLWVVTPVIPLVIQWFFRKFIALEATAGGLTLGSRDGLGLQSAPWSARWMGLYDWSLRLFDDRSELWLIPVLLALWLALLGIGYWESRPENRGMLDADTFERRMFGRRGLGLFGGRPPGWDRRNGRSPLSRDRRRVRWVDVQKWAHPRSLEVLTVAATAGYLLLPAKMHGVEVLSYRAVVPLALMWSAWPRVTFRGKRLWLGWALGAVGVGSAALVAWETARFARTEIADLPQALAALPAQSRLAVVPLDPTSQVMAAGTLESLPAAMFMVATGGLTPTSQAALPWSPIQYRRDAQPEALTGAFWTSPALFDYAHVLVIAHATPQAVESAPHLKRIWQQGPWWLYAVERGNRALIHVVKVGALAGTPAYADCPRGATLAGIEVRAERGLLRGVTPVCRKGPKSAPESVHGPTLGAAPALAVAERLVCGNGLSVVGLSGRADLVPESVQVDCAPVPWPAARGQVVPSQAVGTEEGRPFQLRCPEGNVAVGVQGRFGDRVEQLGLACAPVQKW